MKFLFKTFVVDYDFINNNKEITILFLHGWGGNKHSFDIIKPYLNNYNLLSLSMPPYFLDKEKSATVLNMEDYANLVINLLTLQNIKKIIIVCHSFGFRVTLTLLANRIVLLKLIVTAGAGVGLNKNIFQTISFNQKLIYNKQKKFYFLNKSNDYSTLSGLDKNTFKNIVNKNLKNYVNLINCPTLLFWGKRDKDTPIKVFKFLKSHIKHSVGFVTNSNHFCYLHENKKFGHELLKFLKG